METQAAQSAVPKVGVPVPGIQAIYVFLPAPGITVEELTEVLPLLLLAPAIAVRGQPVPGADVLFSRLSPGAVRHFRVSEHRRILTPQEARA